MSTSPTRVIIVRHGETAWNVEGRYQGHADSVLTSTGRAQAESLAARFAHESFSALYSSDLGRARETARIIAGRTGHELLLDPRLRERSLGVFQGLVAAEAQARRPEDFARFIVEDWDYVPPEGESARQSLNRFTAGLDDLTRRHPGQTVAVVSHGGVLGYFLREVLGIAAEQPRRFRRFNASWNVFSVEEGRWFLDTWGDISHVKQARNLDEL